MSSSNHGEKIGKEARPRVGLALGGGGARGFAHLGILRVFEESGIPIDLLTGTSMGALIGALYAQSRCASAAVARLERVLKEQQGSARLLKLYGAERKGDHFLNYVAQRIQQRVIINLSITRKSLLPASRLELAVADLIEDGSLEELAIKLGVVASDLISAKGVILHHGPVRKAVVASSSIPGFFPPVKWGDLLLVDGEVTDLVPVESCRALGADFVVAVDVTPEIRPAGELEHTLDVFLRSVRITNYRHAENALNKADFVLRPVHDSVPWADFDRLSELIGAGADCARQHLPQIREALARSNCAPHSRADDAFSQTHIDSADLLKKT